MKFITSTCRHLFSDARKLKPNNLPWLFKPRRSINHGKTLPGVKLKTVTDLGIISGPTVTKRPMPSAVGSACIRHFHRLHHRAATPSSPKFRRFSFVSKCSNAASVLPSLLDPLVPQSPSSVVVTSQVAHSNRSNLPQLSAEWFAIRRDKLTTSTFGAALGFWKGNSRIELWKKKVFPVDGDSDIGGSAPMNWGVRNENAAVERYKSITGRDVSVLGFATHSEEKFQWLGASPDGLLEGSPGGGILEVKCPYNKGKPELGLPWLAVPYYYMPQVQGQMEILDRDWVDLYCWTPSGSSIFRINRDRRYWKLIKGILHEFWWDNVIPARELLSRGREEDVILYKPSSTHKQTGLVIVKSIQLAAESKLLCKETAGHVEFQG